MSVIYSGKIRFKGNANPALIDKVITNFLSKGFFVEESGRTITFSGSLAKECTSLTDFVENHSGSFDYCQTVGISDEEPYYCFFDGEVFVSVGIEGIKDYTRSMLEHLSLSESGRQKLVDRFSLDPKGILFSLNERAYLMRMDKQKKSA